VFPPTPRFVGPHDGPAVSRRAFRRLFRSNTLERAVPGFHFPWEGVDDEKGGASRNRADTRRVPMFKENPAFRPPGEPGIPIWRYMDIDKFVDLVGSGTLYLRRADRWPDKWEGLLPDVTRAEWKEVGKWLDNARSQTFANCWQMNTYESYLMWKAYLGKADGVVVQATFNRLVESLVRCQEAVFVGCVNYIDYSTGVIEEWKRGPDIYVPIVYKRSEFRDEREIRVVLNTMSEVALTASAAGKDFVRIPIDVETLIEEVRLSPGAGPECRSKVVEALAAKGINKTVRVSELDKVPP
jgi:hypothetical protein